MQSDLRAALLAAVWAVALISAATLRAWPLTIDIGGRDARFVAGFNETEIIADTPLRWSTGASTIALPRPPALAPAILSLRLVNGRPIDQPIPEVDLAVDNQPLARFEIADRPFRIYRFLVPPRADLNWAQRVTLNGDRIIPPADPRPLGVMVDTVTLKPTGLALPSLWAALSALAAGALGYALPRLAGLSARAGLGVSGGLTLLIALGLALRPLEILPFLQRFPMLLTIGCAGLLLIRLLPRPNGAAAPRAIAGAHLPIVLATAWWMLPLTQLALSADGAPAIRPAPATLWIGGITIVALLAVTLRYRGARHGRLTHAILLVLAGGALAHLGYTLMFAYTRQAPDFWILFRGAREWTRGGSMYDLEAVMTNHFGHVFKVPPFYGMLFTPFVTQDGFTVLLGHRIMNTILILATALIWMRMWRLPLWSLGAAGMAIVFSFRPLADTLAYGQIDLMLLFLLTAALWALRSGRDLSAGALVALGTLFKIYPIILLAFFVAKWRWRALAGFVLGMLLYNSIAIAIVGWNEHLIYLTQVAPNIGGATSWVENQTISGFLARLTDSPRSATIYQNEAIRLAGMFLSALISLAVCILALRPAPREETGYALQFGMFLLLMVLAVPAAWMHYETLLIVPFGALLLHLRERAVSLPYAAILGLSFALIAYGNQWSFYDGTIHGMLTIAGVSYKFYGMLLLGGVLTAEILREPAPAVLPRLARLIARPGQ